MSISFTQILMPDGRQLQTEIDMPQEIETLAHEFIRAGGWFEVEMLDDYRAVGLTACWDREDGDNDIAIEVVPNGPEIVSAVERIVRFAHQQMKEGALGNVTL